MTPLPPKPFMYFVNNPLSTMSFLKGPDNLWSARSTLRRYDDIYELTLYYEDGETKRKEEQTLKK